MSSIYNRLSETAVRLLGEYGQLRTFTNVEYGAYNPGTGQKSETVTTYSALCMKDAYSLFEQNNTAIEVGDLRLVCEDASYAIGDTVGIDSDDWRVMNVDPVGDTTVIYILQVRK